MSLSEGVGSPEGWLCTRMIEVGVQFKRPFDDLARIDGHVINGAFALFFVGDEDIFGIQKQNAELFSVAVGHDCVAIVDQRVPAGNDGQRCITFARAMRCAVASTSFSSEMTFGPHPLIFASAAGAAENTRLRSPK